jgi:hypothetical protein
MPSLALPLAIGPFLKLVPLPPPPGHGAVAVGVIPTIVLTSPSGKAVANTALSSVGAPPGLGTVAPLTVGPFRRFAQTIPTVAKQAPTTVSGSLPTISLTTPTSPVGGSTQTSATAIVSVGNLAIQNNILPFGPAASTGVTGYYPSIPGSVVRMPLQGVGAVGNYQLIQNNFVGVPQQPILNVIPPLSAANDAANGSTDLSIGVLSTVLSGGDEGTIVAPPLANTWVPVNFGGGTSIVNSGTAAFPTVYLSDFTTGGAEVLRGATSPVTITGASKYTLTVAFRPLLVPDNAVGHNSSAGIMISDGTKHISFMYVYVQSAMHMQVQAWTNSTTTSTLYYDQNFNFGINARVWLRVQDDGTHRNWSFSVDGVNFTPPTIVLQQASGTFLTETRQGIMTSPINSAGAAITLESWNPTSP